MNLIRAALFFLLLLGNMAHGAEPCGAWPDWEQFQARFVTESGRVVDFDQGRARTVSEAQAYALFFALIGNDRSSFQTILQWTQDNLAAGDLTSRLPAWLWGQREDGTWGVMDDNPASDADLWLSYALLEAARLWQEPRYHALAMLLARQVLRHETADLPGVGLSLLPGIRGFQVEKNQWRLNPSYSPLFLLRRWQEADPEQGWDELYRTSFKIQTAASGLGLMPNWVLFTSGQGFSVADQDKQADGYDGIRVYLWAGLMSADEPKRQRLLHKLQGMADWTSAQGYPPKNLFESQKQDAGPAAFSWALIPFLQELGARQAAQEQLLRVQAMPLDADAYYANALRLFSAGWLDQRYRIDAQGRLQPSWLSSCTSD